MSFEIRQYSDYDTRCSAMFKEVSTGRAAYEVGLRIVQMERCFHIDCFSLQSGEA